MEKLNHSEEYIAVCIPCCKINKENTNTLPNICPKIQMPCLAFKYSAIKDHRIVMNLFLNPTERISMESEYIDNDYIKECCINFEKIRQAQGNSICAMEVY